jgi:lipopolysaccharide/colanic/teichoic acid biosynthesis glycosyltransferase
VRKRSDPGDSKLKRLLDLVVSAAALLILFPLLALVALAVVIDSGWPPWFLQNRVGRNRRLFRILKFRTMIRNAESKGSGLWLVPGDNRFTRIGPFLRSTSIDELPQFWNVFKGDMSVVGPRPLHPSTLPKLSPAQDLRHRARPGVTGWAVLNGRNSIPYSKRFELDNWYIDNWSLALDLKIILLTVPAVLFARGQLNTQEIQSIDDLGSSTKAIG